MTTAGCEGTGNAPATQGPEGFRAKAEVHKVQLSAAKAAELEKNGTSAKVLADYGSFKLVEVNDKDLNSIPASAGVEVRDDYNHILLNAGAIDTASAHGNALRGMKLQATGKKLHLVQFAGPIQPEWVKAIEATGVKLVTYIPNNAYLVYGDAGAMRSLQRHVDSAEIVQWHGDYLNDFKLDPSIQRVEVKEYTIQLVQDDEANAATLALLGSLENGKSIVRKARGYVNIYAPLSREDAQKFALQPDVVSVQPRVIPQKFDERQNIINIGQITNKKPTGPGYLAWLTSKGFTQEQFTASGFGVDVSDSGIDNGTQAPNHFALYTGGVFGNASRVVYNRLEGTPNAGSTISGCDGHGNLNSHIIGGYVNKSGAPHADAAGFMYGLGVAPFVKVGSSVVFDPGTFTSPVYEDLQARAYRDGMRISSNSWGSRANTYTVDSQSFDSLVRDAQQDDSAVPAPGNQEMVILFAAGNQGSGANTVGSPSTAKNVITVGASENVHPFGGADACSTNDNEADSAYDMVAFSSRGPTSDGRKKPDIVAPGTHISGGVAQAAGQGAPNPANPAGQATSCFDATGVCAGPGGSNFWPTNQQWYTASSGTSHSTPALAGGAALIRQYFINKGLTPPSPAMTKAFLMNSARYMDGVGANDSLFSNNQGMGLMDLGAAFDGLPRKLDDQIEANLFTATGQTRTYTGVVADSSKPFRVTLAWTDAPGATSGAAWKNNLDLSVSVGGNTYKGNVFTGRNSVTGGAADTLNNVESVFLPAGVEGAYTVTVTATNITSDGVPNNANALDQDYAYVAYNTCDAATPAVSGAAAAVDGDNRVSVSWTTNGSASYNIYRANTAGGPYVRVGTATDSPFVDTTVSGSSTYFYTVRAVQCAESPSSNEASVTATGICTVPPTFAGIASAGNAGTDACSATLSWAAASPFCAGTITYSVYRSLTPGFTPSAANRIATGISATTFSDDLNLTSGTAYHYIVRATETSNATLEETNTVQKTAAPTGAVTPGVRYFDDLDGNRPPSASSYWIPTVIAGSATAFTTIANCHYQSPTTSYRFGAAASSTCVAQYANAQQLVLSLGGNGTVAGINGFSIPSTAALVGARMNFNVWYKMESEWDGAWLVYSTTSATGPWTAVSDAVSATAPYVSAGGYDNVLRSSTTTRIWTGANTGANGALKAVTVNLDALAGQKVWFGFRIHTDSTGTDEGFHVDNVNITADGAVSCTTNVPAPGPAVGYKVINLPASTKAGEDATFDITAIDVVGVTATSYTGSATFSSTDAQAVLPASAAFNNGVATGVVASFRTLGAQSITAADSVNPAIAGSAATTVTPGSPTRLVFTVSPANTAAGASITPAVKVGMLDQFGNAVTTGSNSVTIALQDNPGSATLAGTTTITMVNGVATFSNLSITKAANGYTLAASSTGLTGVTSATFNITAATPSKLAYITPPSNSGAGVVFNPAVQVAILDAHGNRTTSSSNVTVALSTNPSGGALLGTATVAAVNGVATFGNLAIDKVGTGYRMTATSGSLINVASGTFDIGPGVAHRVSITRQPGNTVAGVALAPAFEAAVLDKFGNVVTNSVNPVTVTLGNSRGAVLAGTTTVNPVNGVASFADLSVNQAAANYTLVAGSTGLYADTSVGFDVAVGAPAVLSFTASPSASIGSGAAFSAKVAVRDLAGNLVTGASVPVTLVLGNANGATLAGTTTASTVNGVATFTGLSVDKAGAGYTLQAAAAGLALAESAAFGVSAGAPASVAFVGQPGNTTSGAIIAPAVSVAVLDAHGNTVSSSSAKVTLSVATGAGALLGTKAEYAVNGVATFSDLSIEKAGTGYSLRATSGGFTATSASFDVAPGAAAKLVFVSSAGNAAAGANLGSISVEIQDQAGNRVSGSSAEVTLSLGGAAGGELGGTATVAAVDGVATFADLFIEHAASGYTLTASTAGAASVTSGPFAIAAAAAAALDFTVQPSDVVAGAVIAPAVQVAIRDAFGNLVAGNDSITLALADNSAGATLGGTVTVAASNGVATFGDLSVARAGTGYTLTASAGSLAAATSVAFAANTGAAHHLAFTLSPSSTTAGVDLGTIGVEVLDAQGNRVASSANITLSVEGAALAGTTTVAAVNGVATFNGLSIAQAAEGLRVKAQTNGAADAISAAFDIAHGAAAKAVFQVQPGSTQAGAHIAPAVRVAIQDTFGNLVKNSSAAVTLALGGNSAGATLAGTKTVNAANGVATFADLSITKAGAGYQLDASATGLTGASSAAFDVSVGATAKLVIHEIASSFEAGALGAIEVELQDEHGNVLSGSTASVSLTLGENPTGGQLIGGTTVSAANGVAKFEGLSLRKAGNGYTLVASAAGFQGAASTAFNVTPGAATSIVVSLPASVTAGQETTASAIAYDAFGNVASAYAGSAKVTSSDASAVLPAKADFVEGKAAAIKVTFKGSGLRTITLKDEGANLTSSAQTNVTPFAQPTVAVTDPAGGAEVSDEVSITVKGAVAAGTTVAQISILVDGVVIATGTEATLTGTWDSSKVEGETSHTITAIITDAAGNVATSAPVVVTTKSSSCGCAATSGADASMYMGLLLAARYVMNRRRRAA
ncbi:S8 family serine peptidase [Myxococcaceae bacterium GXIMD 01537]